MRSTPARLAPLSLSTVLLTGLLTGSASAQAWNDNFETYAIGSALEGQGGWVGWDGINTTNTVVSGAFAQSGTRSIQPNPGSDTVYQFGQPTSGTWVFVGHVYIPTGFTSTLDYMVMNEYSHGGPYEWGSWITFSGPNGTVTCNCGGFGSGVTSIPYDRWVEVRQEIDLDTDQADIYFDGVLFASYVWTNGYSGSSGHLAGGIEALDLYATGSGPGMYVDNLRLFELAGGIGNAYCTPAIANSTGASAALGATGFTQVSANNVTLNATNMPNNSFGFFLTSRTQGSVNNPGGSAGRLCLGGAIGRYVGPGQIKNSGATGSFSLQLDLTRTPQPTGLVAVAVGETWNFQSWYRDAVGGVATSNFTDGRSILFN